MINVQIIQTKGATSRVQYADEAATLHQVIIPTNCIIDGWARADDLEMAIPYGLPWDEIARLNATSEQLAAELRRRGIWTLQDLESSPQVVVGALQAVYGIDASGLLNRARQYVKNGGNDNGD